MEDEPQRIYKEKSSGERTAELTFRCSGTVQARLQTEQLLWRGQGLCVLV